LSEPKCRFVQIADVHFVAEGEPDLTRTQVAARLGDYRRASRLANTMLRWALEQIRGSIRPDFIAFTGDQVDIGWQEEGWANHTAFRRLISESVNPETPVRYAFGNHDRPRERFVELFGDSVYGFECNGCHFAVLDSGLMHRENGYDSPELFEAGLAQLQELLAKADGQPAAVLLHFWLYPSDVPDYSFPYAKRALRILQQAGRSVPVFSGHLHRGGLSVFDTNLYFTARSFTEAPYAFYLHELSRERLTIYEYLFNPSTGRWWSWPRYRFDMR
jgi:3',5'-cyclic AMP phosphodiesterase CpdA